MIKGLDEPWPITCHTINHALEIPVSNAKGVGYLVNVLHLPLSIVICDDVDTALDKVDCLLFILVICGPVRQILLPMSVRVLVMHKGYQDAQEVVAVLAQSRGQGSKPVENDVGSVEGAQNGKLG